METMDAVKAAARKLEYMTGDQGTNDGEHEAALELLGALGSLFAEKDKTKALTLSVEQARDLHALANSMMRNLRIGMPDDGAIRLDILKPDEREAYELARAVLLALAPWVLARRPARGGR